MRLALAQAIATAVVLAFIGTSQASASPITWDLTGLVTVGDLHVTVGTTVEFALTFDTAQPDQCPTAGAGFWTGSASVQISGSTFVSAVTGLEDANPVGNCVAGGPGVVARMTGFPFPSPFSTAAIETTTVLPPDIFPIDAFHTGDVFRFGPIPGGFFDGQGTITQVNPVPEPTSILVMATGLTWLIRRRRRVK